MAQYAASAAQHSLSPISPAAASSASPAGGPAPTPSSSTTVPGPPSTVGSNSHHQNQQTQAQAQAQAQQHKRVYQACIPCRRRKVRCDLGSVDDPHDPPCVRCRRECKECYFSATRRKRKNEDDPSEELEERDQDDYVIRNGRKQLRTGESPSIANIDRRHFSEVPLTPSISHVRSHPLRRPIDGKSAAGSRASGGGRGAEGGGGGDGGGGEFGAGEPNTPLENFEARTVMRREVYGPHDALDLLYKAATDKSVHLYPAETFGPRRTDAGDLNSSSHKPDDHTLSSSGPTQPAAQRSRPDVSSRHSSSYTREQDGYVPRHMSRREGTNDPAIDPALIKRDPSTDPGTSEALKAWARFRFVRAGWFTAQEAMDYIQ